MSLVPALFSHWWEDLDRPHRLFDQHFGLNLEPEDLLETIAPSTSQLMIYRPHRHSYRYRPYASSRRESKGTSVVKADKDKFKVTLDVQQFSPDEIEVKVVDKSVVVEAKHEEREDQHGWISREFRRKYMIPSQCDLDKVESHLSSDGVLTISAPRKQEESESERKVSIQLTGQPAVTHVEENGSAEKAENLNQKAQNTPQRGRKTSTKAA